MFTFSNLLMKVGDHEVGMNARHLRPSRRWIWRDHEWPQADDVHVAKKSERPADVRCGMVAATSRLHCVSKR